MSDDRARTRRPSNTREAVDKVSRSGNQIVKAARARAPTRVLGSGNDMRYALE
jgi:hypothetical protein